MKILIRHPERSSDGRLAAHCERLLQRILGGYASLIHLIEVDIEPCPEVRRAGLKCRCTLTARLVSGGSAKASVTDCADVLAVYGAAEKMRFCIEQRKRSGDARNRIGAADRT